VRLPPLRPQALPSIDIRQNPSDIISVPGGTYVEQYFSTKRR
jgi:hypothetical protein